MLGDHALEHRQQQHQHGERHDRAGDRPGEEHRPVVREADHRVHEVLLGDRPEDDAEHQRRDRKADALENVAQHAKPQHQPEVDDVVADRQRADEAEHQHIGRHHGLGKIEDLHQRADREIADHAHQDQAEEQRGENRVDHAGGAREHLRTGLDAVQHEGAEDDGGGAAARDAERQQMHQRAADRSGRGGLRRNDALGDAGAHQGLALAEPRLDAVADERGDGGAGARQQPDQVADHRRAEKHALDLVQLLPGRQFGARIGDLVERLGGEAGVQPRQHLADAIGADHHHQEFDAVGEDRRAEA